MPISRSHHWPENAGAKGSSPFARPGKPRAARRRREAGLIVALHRDEGGTISIVSVFTMMLLAMILGMVMNVGRQVDGKVKMQNAADAATYSGGLVVVRGMNTLVFTNRLLFDVFAVTAYLREAEQQNAASLVPQILAAWKAIGPVLGQSQFPKFAAAGPAITQKVPMEQQMVQAYSDWVKATADIILPTWEQILQQELIPNFQRALVTATPMMSQLAANEIARRHGLVQGVSPADRGNMQATMWRTNGNAIGANGETSAMTRTLPVVDPELDNVPNQAQYQATATQQRNNIANNYLTQWNNQMMAVFDRIAQMSQFGVLWRGFTCGQLNKLLNQDYPNSNLPFVIRADGSQLFGNPDLEGDYHFVGVCYWPPLTEALPGLFTNPKTPNGNNKAAVAADQTFAAVTMYIPRNRLVWQYINPNAGGGNNAIPIGGVPGDAVNLPGTGNNNGGGGGGNNAAGQWIVGRQGNPTDWDLLNQNWTLKLVPAVSTNRTNMLTILQTPPPVFAAGAQVSQVPALGNLSIQDWNTLNSH